MENIGLLYSSKVPSIYLFCLFVCNSRKRDFSWGGGGGGGRGQNQFGGRG